MLDVDAGEKDFLFSEKGIKYLQAYLSEQGLSRRETEVVILVLQGLTNKQVADKLCVAEKTVKFHLTNIYKRMKISRRSQIVWTLPLGDFVEKARKNISTKDPHQDLGGYNESPKGSDEEISIPTGCRSVDDIQE